MVWVGRTLKIIWFQTPCHEQGHLPLDQVAQSPADSLEKNIYLHTTTPTPPAVPPRTYRGACKTLFMRDTEPYEKLSSV